MVNDRVVIDVTAAVHKVQTIEQCFAALAVEHGSDVVTGNACTEGQGVRIKDRAARLLNIDIGQVEVLQGFLLQLHVRKIRIRGHIQTSDRTAQRRIQSILTDIMLNDGCTGTGFQRNQVAGKAGATALGTHKHQMNRLFQMLASRKAQHRTVLGQGQVQSGRGSSGGFVPISLLQPICILLQTGAQRSQTNARRHFSQVRQGCVVMTIHKDQEIPVFFLAHRRNQIRCRRRLLRSKNLLLQQSQRRVMPGFNARGWPAFLGKTIQGALTHSA